MQPNHLRIIQTTADIDAGIRALNRKCPAMRRYPAGLACLSRIIVAQQVSAASATAIWSRLDTAIDTWQSRILLDIPEVTLRGAGLSNPKVRTLKTLAADICAGKLDIESLSSAPDDAVRETLTQVSGIGPWTADIYLMFCLGRADAFAPGDLALMTAAGRLLDLDERPGRAQLEEIAERWRPWRGVAARLLWACHPLLQAPRSANKA